MNELGSAVSVLIQVNTFAELTKENSKALLGSRTTANSNIGDAVENGQSTKKEYSNGKFRDFSIFTGGRS